MPDPDRPSASRARQRAGWLAAVLCAALSPAARAAVPVYSYDVVHVYPHDPHAFTEGLFYLNGFLYESTGLEGESSIRKVRLETGEVLRRTEVPERYFGEGIVNWGNEIVSLTWKSGIGFVRTLDTFKVKRDFHYAGEGWALTQDGHRLIMSDGTDELRYLDPSTLKETARLRVRLEGKPLAGLNELEWVRGEIWANVWQTQFVVQIDPSSGAVTGVIDLSGLLAPEDIVPGQTDVLNGIAYDAAHDRLFVTGKKWPKLFEIRVHALGPRAATAR